MPAADVIAITKAASSGTSVMVHLAVGLVIKVIILLLISCVPAIVGAPATFLAVALSGAFIDGAVRKLLEFWGLPRDYTPHHEGKSGMRGAYISTTYPDISVFLSR